MSTYRFPILEHPKHHANDTVAAFAAAHLPSTTSLWIGALFIVLLATHFSLSHATAATLGNDCLDYGEYIRQVSEIHNSPDYPYTSHDFHETAVTGEYVYAASSYGGVYVINISDPLFPQIESSVDTMGYATGICLAEYHLYVTTRDGGLVILDLNVPSEPVVVGTVDMPSEAWSVAVHGDHAYVADGESGLQVIDIQDTSAPDLVGAVDTPGTAQFIWIDGMYAYTADRASGLQVIDISNPQVPEIVGALALPDEVFGVVTHAGVAYVAGGRPTGSVGGYVAVVDITTPALPEIIRTIELGIMARGVAVEGEYLFVANSAHGLMVYDLSTPSDPVLTGGIDSTASTQRVTVSEPYAYLADKHGGLKIIDLGNHKWPDVLGVFVTPGWPNEIVVVGDYAFVAEGNAGLQVYDVTAPLDIQPRGNVDIDGHASGLFISEGLAYVANYLSDGYLIYGNLQIVDISNPDTPSIIGGLDTLGDGWEVSVEDDHAFVADGRAGITIVDVANPALPAISGNIPTETHPEGIIAEAGYLYIADGEGLKIVDPESQQTVGSVDTPGTAKDICKVGDLVYVADRLSGVQVIDVHEPSMPILIGSADTPSTCYDVYVLGDYAYLSESSMGVQIVNVKSPHAPYHIGGCDRSDPATSVAMKDELVIVTTRFDGLQVIPAQCDDNDVPVFLSQFSAAWGNDLVQLDWQVSGSYQEVDFRLMASVEHQHVSSPDPNQWEVPWRGEGYGRYSAQDNQASQYRERTVNPIAA